MSTHGILGFVLDEQEKFSEIGGDAYPSGAGVADLDRRSFKVYKGFQRSPHTEGRFADRPPPTDSRGEYYPPRLVAAWPFDALPTSEEFVTTIPCPVEADARERGLPSRFDDG